MGAILSEAQIAAVDDTMAFRDLSGQGDRIARLMTINAEQRLEIEKLRYLLNGQQKLSGFLDARASNVPGLIRSMCPYDYKAWAEVVAAIAGRVDADDVLKEYLDCAHDRLTDMAAPVEAHEPMDWSAAERERGQL